MKASISFIPREYFLIGLLKKREAENKGMYFSAFFSSAFVKILI